MRSSLQFAVLLLAGVFLVSNQVFAQLNGYSHQTPIEIIENRGENGADYILSITVNTASIIGAGQMQPDGDDIRFAESCSSTVFVPYWIESGINTPTTKIWLRLPSLTANDTLSISMFSGNATATAGSAFASVFQNVFTSSGNSSVPVGTYNYDYFEILVGDTITVIGNSEDGLRINSALTIINGVLEASGQGSSGAMPVAIGNGPGGGEASTNAGSGGGSYGGIGGAGGYDSGDVIANGGPSYGTATGLTIELGSSGGGGNSVSSGGGGGAIWIKSFELRGSGLILANGIDGDDDARCPGGGAGGGILLEHENGNFSLTCEAKGGNGGIGTSGANDSGGGGGGGRIKVAYYNSQTGTPTLSVTGGIGGPNGSLAPGQNGTDGTTDVSDLTGEFVLSVLPTVPASGNTAILTNLSVACLNDSLTYLANSNGNNSYSWQLASGGNIVNGQGTNAVTIAWTAAGTHELILTDASGCSSSDTLVVTVSNNSLNSGFSVGAACVGSPITFVPAATASTSYSYNWALGDGNSSATYQPSHIYANTGNYSATFTITDNAIGCSSSTTNQVVVAAAPVANFTFSSPTCPTGAVTFTNSSSNATAYLWDFGDGSATSIVTSPTHSYTTAGTYTVTLTATANTCTSTIAKVVTISANPVPNFSISGDTLACINLNETYTTNIGGGNTITWALSGGGTIASGQGTNSIEIDWVTPGSYFVKVTATSAAGCTTSDSLQVDVDNVINVGVPTFTQACAGEVTQFTANAPATGGPYTFFWDFNDGSTSTNQNPTHIFAAAGSYSVTLVITSPANCTGTSTSNVVVPAKPVAAFVASPACPGAPVSFTNTSTNATTYVWDFGDGTTSSDTNPTHAYTVAGTYTVTLTAISTPNCSHVTTRSVTVSPRPTVDFSAISACPDSLVRFTNLSTVVSGTITSYSWSFGDGNTSGSINPTHAYLAAGTYQVTLAATTNIGCKDSLTRNVTVYAKPVANFTANTPVCNDSVVTFTNASNIATGTLSYAWSFGDGGSSTNINPTRIYAAPGTYNVTLTATSNNGCKDTAVVNVLVNNRPNAGFTASATTICLGDTILFTNTGTTGAGLIIGYNFGDGNQGQAEDTAYVYTTSGTFQVVQLIANPLTGCFDTTSIVVVVNEEPNANFTATDVCNGTAVGFTNQSTIQVGTLSHLWNFGDGNFSTNINPTHLYATTGTYNVLLTVTSNNGCVDTITKQVTVFPEPLANFTLSSETACDRDTVFFTNTSIVSGINIVYTWAFGDGNTSNSLSPAYVYGGPGTYSVVLTVTDTLTGCTDVASDTVTIFHRAVPAFTTADVCLGTAAVFTNNTTLAVGTASYVWDFGDTTFSTDINPTHVYDSIGIKTVTLVVTTNNGCSDTTVRTLIVNPQPDADFSVGPTCFGNTTSFTNLSSIAFGTNTYLWNFGDGTTSTDSNATHTYTVLGNYTATLTATSNAGCVNVANQVITVHPNPTANFNRSSVCEDDTVVFENTASIPYGTLTSFWQFGDGFTSIADNPTYTYTGFGTFTATLISTSNHGCADTVSKTVIIYPKPIVQFDVEDVCIGEVVEFDNISAVPNGGTIANIKWYFGDGAVSLETSPRHLYAAPGIYEPFLVVTSTQGCTDTLRKTVVVHELPPATIQALGPLAFCDGGSVELRGPAGQAGYLWSTGETTQNITVTTSGTYGLTVTSVFNCTNSSSITVTVWPLPIANAGNDTTISKGYTAQLNGSGGADYEWTPTESLSNASIANPVAKPLVTTTYTLLVTDANGCQDSDEVTVFVNEDYLVQATNTLTPNGDGKNDFWYIINIETYPDVEVLIFDRWGTEVYTSKAYNNDWDGTYKDSKLPEGTYYYVIRFEGSDRLYKGAVNILR